eukprot:2669694-Amphidinium_carterae.2
MHPLRASPALWWVCASSCIPNLGKTTSRCDSQSALQQLGVGMRQDLIRRLACNMFGDSGFHYLKASPSQQGTVHVKEEQSLGTVLAEREESCFVPIVHNISA